MQQVKQQQKEEGFDTAKDYEDNFPSLGGDLGGTEEFDENDEQYEDVEGDECEEIIIDEEDDKTIQAFTGGGVRNVFYATTAHWSILKASLESDGSWDMSFFKIVSMCTGGKHESL